MPERSKPLGPKSRRLIYPKSQQGLPQLDLVARLQKRPASIAVDRYRKPIANDVSAAIAFAPVDAVVHQTAFACLRRIQNVRMFAGDAPSNFILLTEGDVVAARQA